MFKIVFLAGLVAVARAGLIGAPLTYAAAPIHAPAIGASQQSVVRSLDGNSAISHYSKAVDTAFSSVRKYDTRVTNDAKYLSYATAPISYAAPAYAASPIVKAYAAPAYAAQAYAAPAYAAPAYAAPAYAPAYGSPSVIAHTTFTGLGASYAF